VLRTPGAGNSTLTKHYQGKDNHPYKGISYYRLKQVDFDGAYSYSDIKSVNFTDSEEQVHFYPNPSSGVVHITNLNSFKDYVINFYDLTGKLMVSKNTTHQNNFTFSAQELASGLYIIQILTDDQIVLVEKFIKE
jgi:hypothetical protein